MMQPEHTTVESLLTTPDAFRAWLQGRRPHSVVGMCGATDGCPLATFVVAKTGTPYISVGTYSVLFGRDMVSASQVRLPYWAAQFVDAVDRLGLGRVVCASEALSVFDTFED